MTPAQLRAARGFLGLSRERLKLASGVSVETIRNIEHARYRPEPETVAKLHRTFTSFGIAFFDLPVGHPVWGVALQPLNAQEQDNWPLTGDEQASQEWFDLVTRMAGVIADTIREQGQCGPADIEAAGFSAAEVARAWTMANALAHVQIMDGGEE